jgi:fermentation-respiration switch protein FrsA (DUF1100 family)
VLARWAQAGFVVAGPKYPHTWYGAADFDALDIVNQPADASHVLDQLLALAGTDLRGAAFTGPAAAMLFVHGRKDTTVAYRAGHTVFEAVPWSRAMLSITDGGHVISDADFETTTSTSTEFLRWSLYGDAAARARIPSAAAIRSAATLENQL